MGGRGVAAIEPSSMAPMHYLANRKKSVGSDREFRNFVQGPGAFAMANSPVNTASKRSTTVNRRYWICVLRPSRRARNSCPFEAAYQAGQRTEMKTIGAKPDGD